MNSVSWLIYIGGIGDNAPGFGVIGFLAFAAAVAATITVWATSSPTAVEDKDAVYVKSIASRARFVAWPICILFWLVALFLPAKDTMYAVATSQIGERIAGSTVANDATKALQIWLKKQIEPEAKK